jgi:hypothetical protein
MRFPATAGGRRAELGRMAAGLRSVADRARADAARRDPPIPVRMAAHRDPRRAGTSAGLLCRERPARPSGRAPHLPRALRCGERFAAGSVASCVGLAPLLRSAGACAVVAARDQDARISSRRRQHCVARDWRGVACVQRHAPTIAAAHRRADGARSNHRCFWSSASSLLRGIAPTSWPTTLPPLKIKSVGIDRTPYCCGTIW